MRVDAAPPESAPTWRLRLVAGWFSLGGWAGALSGSVLLVCVALGVTPLPRVAPYGAWTIPLAMLAGLGSAWTGRLLGRGERAGGFMALATLGLPVLTALPAIASGRPYAAGALVTSAIGCALVASVWRELD